MNSGIVHMTITILPSRTCYYRYKDCWPIFPSLPLFFLFYFFPSFSYSIYQLPFRTPATFTMKSKLLFLTYLVAFFATHTTCAPQRTFADSFYVSSGQTCDVPGGIVRVLPKKNAVINLLYNMYTNLLLPKGGISF